LLRVCAMHFIRIYLSGTQQDIIDLCSPITYSTSGGEIYYVFYLLPPHEIKYEKKKIPMKT